MRSSISGILAIPFMDKSESIALSSYRLFSPYKRYVDDIYLQTINEEKAIEFHSTINSLHPRLKFEIEKPTTSPEGLSLSLLDFKVTISANGKSSFEYFKKPLKICYLYTTSQPHQGTQRSTSSVTDESIYSRNAPPKQHSTNTTASLTTDYASTDTQKMP